MKKLSLVLMIILTFLVFPTITFAQIDPLTQWTYRESTFNYVSGLMDLTNSSDSLTVFLTNQNINCSHLPIAPNNKPGAWIEIEFPELSIKDYSMGKIKGTMSCYIFGSYWGAYTGYLGSAGITSIDTIEKRVIGWINFEPVAFDVTLSAIGSFNVPYCSSPASSIPENSCNEKPISFELHQNYPNPFNPSTTIEFTQPTAATVKLEVYNTLGQIVGNLVEDKLQAGSHEYGFNASHLPSGVYFYRLQAGAHVDVKKMILLK